MPNAENAKIQYEGGQTSFPMEALSDFGDLTIFDSQASLWSGKSGFEPNVKPNGMVSGGAVVPAVSGANNQVDVAALVCYLAGVKTTVSGVTNEAITRPASNVARINSITVDNTGSIAVIAGVVGTDQNFEEARGAAGGPPYIPVGSIEIAQVRLTTSTAAPITADQIFSLVGLHKEMWNYPLWNEVDAEGKVVFASALPAIHTGDAAKAVYASYAEPDFVDVRKGTDFKAAEKSYSVTSTQLYGTTIGASSSSLGQGGFTAHLDDGVGDGLVGLKGQKLWFRHYPNRYASNYTLTQGVLGIAREWPAGDSIKAACTISAEEESTDVIA